MQDYWNYIVTLLRPSIMSVPRLLTYEGVRTRMMDIIFHEVAALIAPKKAKWATTGCTLLTNGATDTTNKPIMNFIAAGQSGPILVRTIDMSHREKTGVGLADIWEGVIRDDIGIDKVNAICTDNAEVMKTAAGILQSHPDPAMRRVPWIPCAAHCLSLLLRDIVSQPWAATVMKKAHKLVKFMRNKQRALTLHKAMRNALVLKRPAETRFGTAFMMLERLYEQRGVLDKLVSGELWAQVRWTGDARRDEPEPAHAAAYRLDPRRHDISLLTDRSSPVVQSALDHLARCQGASWESDSLHKLWQALWTFHCEDPRYWPKSGAHRWDEFAVKDAVEGGMHAALWWELHGGQEPRLQTIAKRVLGMWSTTSPCERNWSTNDFIHTKRRNRLSAESVEKLVFIHWNSQLLSASRRTDRRYIDVWEDQVEDPAEEIDDDDSVPAEVPEEEWEEIDRRNRRKEGRNRFGKGKAPMEDKDEDEEGDEALWQDAVWMHREMMEAQQERRDAGRTLPEDQHDLLDEWGGADPHTDFDAYIRQSVDTVRSLRGRVGGRLDLEELLTGDGEASGREVGQEEERGQHIPHSSIAGEGGHTGGVPVDARTSAPAAPHHAAERILRGAEEEMIGGRVIMRMRGLRTHTSCARSLSRLYIEAAVHRASLNRLSRGSCYVAGMVMDWWRAEVESVGQRVDDRADPLPASVAELGAEQRVEQRVDEMVQDWTEQRADQRIEHRRERRDGHNLEVQVDVPWTRALTTVGRHGGGTSSPAVSPGSSLHHPPSVTLRRAAAHASRASTSSVAAAPRVRSPLGMPLLPARLPSAIVDNVETSRACRKRRREDDGGALPPPPRSQGGTGRPRGRLRGSGSGRGRGKGRDSWAMSALGADDAGEDDVGQGTTACTDVTRPTMTYDALSREVVAFEARSASVSTSWHKDLDKGKKWKGRTVSGQVKTKDHLILTLDEGGMDQLPYEQIEWGLEEEEDSSASQGRTYAAVAAGGRPQGRGGGQGQGGRASGGRSHDDQGVGGRGGNLQAGGRGQGPPQNRSGNRSPNRATVESAPAASPEGVAITLEEEVEEDTVRGAEVVPIAASDPGGRGRGFTWACGSYQSDHPEESAALQRRQRSEWYGPQDS
ncbi:hypothetical protein CBR_g39860 [Chara braunii]|uniref:DUF659 domain-containing protein n=1 Tax=Chara braunii TaxID=69332 RepID=A0A388LSV5_CHABU|nr:hypothetical protein CBR_g39860 [Chara braunii]|eukprot:GBG85292.1 hypothetical protein CBR_g39860 [Chara braunii]